ncbi:MAG TPA: hypothetical protein VJR25_11810 [Microbacterium sp.]|uniref:hypothetical protein n=1 Tax=Microbacterium sp. TaxID=51671 RepID=UPI002B485EF7|nr:hypothetical protein [Microbacterium sp.]HKT57446.1 hypothetical protein [Microbacterium sp.]
MAGATEVSAFTVVDEPITGSATIFDAVLAVVSAVRLRDFVTGAGWWVVTTAAVATPDMRTTAAAVIAVLRVNLMGR